MTKNKNIYRAALWFETENGRINQLSDDFFGLSTLLDRLINEKYNGKKIKFLNIFFANEAKYKMITAIPMNYTHYYGGHLSYYGVFDIEKFNILGRSAKQEYIWRKAYHSLCAAGRATMNEELIVAAEHAYNRGLEINLNQDYRVIERTLDLSGQNFLAAVWILFKEDGMYSKFTLEKDGHIVFEKDIDKTENGIEFFLDIYKGIDLQRDNIIIKGSRDVGYLPLKIPIKDIQVNADF